MISTRGEAVCRTSALLLVSAFLAGGCGSAMSQQRTPNSTVSQAASSTASVAASSKSRANEGAGRGARPSGVTGQTVGSDCVLGAAARRTCRSRPVRATVAVLRAPSGPQVAVVHTDDAGRFRLRVPPGDYTLVSRTSGYFLYARNLAVHVRRHRLERVLISFLRRHPLPVGPMVGAASSDPRRVSRPLVRFARSYLKYHVCIRAPTTTQLAVAVAQAIDARPGTTAPAAASGVCNPTR
jgi:hypothetical protein